MTTTEAKPLSPYHLRQFADSLRAFGAESAERQITLHLQHGTITAKDAETLRGLVRNTAAWLY